MRRQAATRSRWASLFADYGFALTVLVAVPFVVTRGAFVVHRARTPGSPSELKKLLEFERDLERRGYPIHATPPEWPPQDLPINLQYDPFKRAPLFIHSFLAPKGK